VPAQPHRAHTQARRSWSVLSAALLATGVACAYALTSSGHLQSADVLETWEVAVRLVAHGTVTVTSAVLPGGGAVIGAGGRHYAAHGIGMSLLLVPAVVALRALGVSSGSTVGGWAATAVDPVAATVLVVSAAGFARRLTDSASAGVTTGLVIGFGSLVWPYAHVTFDVLPTAALLVVGVSAIVRSETTGLRSVVLSGAAIGAALLVRVDAGVVLPFALGYLVLGWWARPWPRVAIAVGAWAVPVVLALAGIAWFNLVRFGSVLDDGHRADPQVAVSNHALRGLYGLVASPGKGVLWYCPVVVLGAAGAVALWHRSRPMVALVVGPFLVSLAYHAVLANWSGDEAWGPRFLVPTLAPALLPIGMVLGRWRELGRAARALVSVIVVAGAGAAAVGVGWDYLAVERANGGVGRRHYWSVSGSALTVTARTAGRVMAGRAPYPDAAHGGVTPAPVPAVDVWWVGARARRIHAHTATTIALGLAVVVVLTIVAAVALAAAGSGRRTAGSQS